MSGVIKKENKEMVCRSKAKGERLEHSYKGESASRVKSCAK